MTENLEQLKNLLLKRSPLLFTGAGFSLGGKRKNNNDIPSGKELKILLLTELLKIEKESKEYKELINYSLSDICQYCKTQLTEAHLIDYLTDIFSDCKPASYHSIISKYNWKKIYTTNIDDLFENSADPNSIIVQNLSRLKINHSTSKTEYIKLHGCVRNPSEKIVFSSTDYVDSMLNSKDYRFSQFGQDIQFGDFVFVGSDFNEINLDYYLKLYESSDKISSKGKLFFINPSPSLIFKSKVESIGGKIIPWTTEMFAEFIDKEIFTKNSSQVSNIEIPDGFFPLNKFASKISKKTGYSSNLYLGYQPEWEDVFLDWDFQNQLVLDNFSDFRNYCERYNIKNSIYSLVGKTFIGKSTYLKRLGLTLLKEDFEVFEFRGRRFDYFSFIGYCRKSQHDKICLIVDNGSYYYGAIKNLVKSFPTSKELIVLTSSRPFFHSRKKYNLVTENFFDFYIDSGIDGQFAVEIENRLNIKGFLGHLKSKAKEERVKSILKGRDLTSVLFSITYGKGFLNRYRKHLDDSFEKYYLGKEILVKLAIFSRLDLAFIPIEMLTVLYGSELKKAFDEIDDFIKFNNYNGIELRNQFLTESILRKTSRTDIINNIKEILVNISPQVTEEIHSYWNEIQATLMKEKLLRKKLRIPSQEIKELLFSIQSYYSDNYNYWLQVGIAEQFELEYDKALNHFRIAESISSNSYMVKNAIARNFLKQGNSQNDHVSALPYFEEGEKLMIELINQREEFQVKAFSTHCYLYEKINFLEKFNISPSNKELKDMFGMLKVIIDKTPDDAMSKHISNKFFNYLVSCNKQNIIKIELFDLSKVKSMFEQYNIDVESLFEDFEIDE